MCWTINEQIRQGITKDTQIGHFVKIMTNDLKETCLSLCLSWAKFYVNNNNNFEISFNFWTMSTSFQTASDHRRALVLVSQLGSRINQKLFQRVFDRISKVQRIAITDNNAGASTTTTTSKPRHFHTRYLSKTYPIENNDWGDFQLHRSLLGLITVGCYSTTQELSELTRLHDATKVRKLPRTLMV